MNSDGPHAQLLELARSKARRHRHVTTHPEHLLAVALDVRGEAGAIHERGLDPTELRDQAEARLADLPVVATYRDGADAPISPAVTRALGRCSGTLRFLLRRRPLLVEALLLEPAVAALVVALRRGLDHRYVIERARALAIVGNHELVGLAHVFRALLDLPSFVATLERAGGAPDKLATFLSASLADAALGHGDAPRAEETITRLLAMSKGASSIRQLCIHLTSLDESSPFWGAAGVTRAAFLHAVHVPP